MNDDVLALWSRAAESYETVVPYFELMGERIVARAALAPGEAVLDVACGKGATVLPAARGVGGTGTVVGIDIVPTMVEATRDAAAAAGLTNVTAEVMDGEALTFPPDTFDLVICAFGLGFLRPELALAEMARVLRPTGRIVLSAPAGGGADWEFFGELCRRYGATTPAAPGGTTMPGPQEMADVFALIGLSLEPPVVEAVDVLFPDADAWWRWVWSHGQRGYLEGLDDATRLAFREDAGRALASIATPEGIPLHQEFIVLVARPAS